MLTYRLHQGRSANDPLTLFVWSHPSTEREVLRRRQQAFQLLIQPFPWVQLYCPDQDEIKAHLCHNSRVLKKASYLRNKFGKDTFHAVYYAHDISADFIAQTAMQAFPNAERVCFGDAFGVVYSNDYFTNLTYPLGGIHEIFRQPRLALRNILFRLKRTWTLPSRKCRMDASHAVLMLPCDPGGDFLEGKVLLPVNQDCLHDVLDGLSNAAKRHLMKRNHWVDKGVDLGFVMLLGSFSESRLTSEHQECALYAEVARLHIAPGSRIILKPHPVSDKKKLKRIVQALSSRYDLVVAESDEFPIETMPWLVKQSKVLSFSYSSVSLIYLYGSTVLHVMNESRINEFFPEQTREWMNESNKLYLGQLAIARQLRSKQPEVSPCQK